MACCGSGRPSRSDAHLSKEEEEKVEEETRDYFDGLAPKRHSKPQRSEYSASYADGVPSSDGVIPEQVVFQQLEHDDSQVSLLCLFFQSDRNVAFRIGCILSHDLWNHQIFDLFDIVRLHVLDSSVDLEPLYLPWQQLGVCKPNQ